MMHFQKEKGNIFSDDSVFARIVTECGARFSSRMIFSTPKGRPLGWGKRAAKG